MRLTFSYLPSMSLGISGEINPHLGYEVTRTFRSKDYVGHQASIGWGILEQFVFGGAALPFESLAALLAAVLLLFHVEKIAEGRFLSGKPKGIHHVGPLYTHEVCHNTISPSVSQSFDHSLLNRLHIASTDY
jgi:hypothetical protein